MNAQLQNNRAANPVASFNAFMQKHKSQLELALPKHLNADRMVRLSLTAFSQNPALQKCDPKTIFGSIIVASQLGLEIGVNGQGYLVPYKDKCTFVPGWKGLVDLANRGGRCTVWTGAVYEGDEFDYMLGDSPYCKHKPCGEFEESKLTHVYAIGRVKDSEMPVIEVWPIKKVHAHFKKTVVPALQSNHYSKKHLEAYAKKVALLQVLKYMPQSIEMSNAVDVSYAAEQGKGITIDGDFVSVDNSPQDIQQDQDVQNSTQNEVNHYQEQGSQEVQTFDQEEVVYAPNFEQIKKGILTAKSVVHLEVIEEQALDHADSNERKHLMTLIKAQYQKFQAAEVAAAKKSEPEQAVEPPAEEKPKTKRQPKAVEEAPATDNDVSVDELKRLQAEAEAVVQQNKQPSSAEMKKEYAKALNTAKSLADVLDIEEQIENDNALTQADFQYLRANIEQVRAKFEQQQTPVIDPIKSGSVKNGLTLLISDAKNGEDLRQVAQQMNAAKPNLTSEHQQELLQAYQQKKKLIEDQMDMFPGN
ncbi:recombinase RecT [Acinetobacter schindleri]|uniref:recombinase RecT n=1 Tax=Acinetobacter schindleri TaxID=108981 RepID=UPI002FDD550F